MSTEYGNRLKQARAHARLTQVQLFEKTNIPQSTISTAERKGQGSSETVVYAKICGVNAHWLATGEGDMQASLVAIPSADPLTVLIKRLSHELQNVEAANRPLMAHAIKTWADAPDQWELLVQQLRNLGVNAGMEPPEPKREAPVTAPTLSTGYFKGRPVYGDDQVPERRATPSRRNSGGA